RGAKCSQGANADARAIISGRRPRRMTNASAASTRDHYDAAMRNTVGKAAAEPPNKPLTVSRSRGWPERQRSSSLTPGHTPASPATSNSARVFLNKPHRNALLTPTVIDCRLASLLAQLLGSTIWKALFKLARGIRISWADEQAIR